MANQLESFDPVGSFQGARSKARTIEGQEQDLALQPARNELAQLKLGGERTRQSQQGTQFDQSQSLQRITLVHQSAKALRGLDPSQRPQAAISIGPELEKFGIPASKLTAENLTDAELDNTIASTQAFIQGGDPKSFQKGATALVETDAGPAFATSVLDPSTGETKTSIAPINAKLVSKLGESGQEQTLRKIEEAGGRAEAKGISDRNQEVITNGLAAADGTAVLKRGIDLLNTIETGGFDRARLASRQLFGIETADEGELSNLLGKAVLAQLRETFGAAFTAKEGDSLKAIDANLGKSPAANKRLLQNALRIAERSAKRGIDRAVAAEDFQTAADIQDSLDFVLKPEEAPVPEGLTDNGDGTFTMPDGQVIKRKGGA